MEDPKKGLASTILALLLLGVLVAIPFSTKTKSIDRRDPPLVLHTEDELYLLKDDKDNNGVSDVYDMIITSITPEKQQVASTTKVDPKLEKELDNPNNLTASFAKQLYTASAYFSKQGNVSDEEKEAYITALVKQEGDKIVAKTYTEEDLHITPSNDTNAKKTYGNQMALLQERTKKYNLMTDDFATLTTYLEKKDEKILNTFTAKKAHYDEIISDLLKIPVPRSAILYHLRLINAFSYFSVVLEGLSSTNSDPIRSLALFKKHEEAVAEVLGSINSVVNYFTIEKVPFTENEPGYIFIKPY